jgi:PAS domain S-box-containing protein
MVAVAQTPSLMRRMFERADVFTQAFLKRANRSRLVAYSFAVLISLAMVAVRLLLSGVFGGGNWFIQSHPAVLISAWVGGFGPGVAATFVSAATDAFVFVPPPFSWEIGRLELVLTATFAGIGVLVSALTAGLRSSRASALKAKQIAQAAERRYRQLLDVTPVAVFVQTAGAIAYANTAMARLLGVAAPRLLLGRDPIQYIDPESQDLVRSRTRQMIEGEVERVPWGEQRWRRVDGRQIIVDATATLVPWDECDAIQIILRDVTAERAASAERERLLEAARAANRTKDEFLATLSHELRTPLNAVLGWAQMLRNATLPPDEYPRAFEVIHRNCELQARLIEDVLDFSRISKGLLTLQLEPLDISEVVAETAEILTPTFAAKQQRVELDLTPACVVDGDFDRLRQVMWNILINASKFTPEAGVIRATTRCENDSIRVAVRDNGIGLAPQFVPHVFDAFRQWDSSATREHGGLGLGLAVVRRLVEAHSGNVIVSSAGPGKGSTVEIRLPRIPVTAEVPPAA